MTVVLISNDRTLLTTFRVWNFHGKPPEKKWNIYVKYAALANEENVDV